jgi:hypothetical protein
MHGICYPSILDNLNSFGATTQYIFKPVEKGDLKKDTMKNDA